MSQFKDLTGRAIARQTRAILKGAGATLAGRERGRDREVRRNSYDVDDPRAKPWSKIGNGTVGEGLAHREALVQTAREHHQLHRRAHPPTVVREARHRRRMIEAELAHLATRPPAAGAAAALRVEARKLDKVIAAADAALRKIDIEILRSLVELIDFATGKLFPAIETIAARAACHRNSVVGALRRLKTHGFIAWVRRSVSAGNEGEFAPQREQTSNAYYFEHRQAMANGTWQRFVQLLTAKLRRLGKVLVAQEPYTPPPPGSDRTGLHEALAALGALVTNAST